MNGSSNASSLNPRRLAVRGGLVVVYAALMALAFTPFVLFRRELAFTACHTYCRWVRWTAA